MADLSVLLGRGGYERSRIMPPVDALLERSIAENIRLSYVVYRSSSATLWVDGVNGNDANTLAQVRAGGGSVAWQTIGRAAWGSTDKASPNTAEAAAAGDVVSIAAGTYTQSAVGASQWDSLYNPANSGTAGNPITFYAAGRAILQSTVYQGPLIGANFRDYIVWDGGSAGFYIDEEAIAAGLPSDCGPATIFASEYCVLRNIEINGTLVAWNNNHNAFRLELSNHCTIENCLAYGLASNGNPVPGQNDAAVMTYDSSDNIFQNNEFHDCGVGVFLKGWHPGDIGQRRNIIRKNLIYNMESAGIVDLGAVDSRIYQNVVRDCVMGLTVYGATNADGEFPSGGIFANNTVVDCTQGGFRFRGTDQAWAVESFYNNIVYGATDYAVHGGDFVGPENAVFEHNVYYGFDVAFAAWGGVGRTFAYWKSTWSKDSVSPLSTDTTDPLFENAAGNDFRLQTGSPALTMGVDVLDLDGDGSTTDTIPAGAYITGNETIGRT